MKVYRVSWTQVNLSGGKRTHRSTDIKAKDSKDAISLMKIRIDSRYKPQRFQAYLNK